ncbi:MAG: VOC family protein [Nitrospirota bacterium]
MPSYNFGTVTLGGAKIMLTRLPEKVEGSKAAYPTKRPVEIYLEIADVDTYHDDVKQRGVKITAPLGTQWRGDRTFKVVDPLRVRAVVLPDGR